MSEEKPCCGDVSSTEGADYLGGCIPFEGEERINPDGCQIRSPGITILDLVRNFVVLRGGEILTCRPAEIQPDEKILAVEPNEAAIKIVNQTYEGRGVLIADYQGKLKTYDEWPAGFARWTVQAVRAGSGVQVHKPAGRVARGVQTIPRAGGRQPVQLGYTRR